ncbi:unnamed protein product [Trifolium pratense]|uniref:Uncharacterized protein n=1 Tax=Trifolium pratense TaxID=57577 RepID=A0ACB0LKV2_TRIPR|nr:unnamed protein product [Trifolium pratense]
MAEGATATNDSTSLIEVGKLFGQFFGILFAIIGYEAMDTSKGKSLLMMALVFMLALYYLVLVLVTMLQFQIQSLLPFMIVVLLLGSVVSFLALIIISPMIAWIYFGLWFLIFALMCYKYRKVLYQMIHERIKNFMDGQTHNGNSEIPIGVRSLPV